MEAGATTKMTAKLPILYPREYDLWLMRIKKYFIMTDYSLWEVIKNGNKVLKKTVGTSEETYEPTSAEEKLGRRNEIKARGTLLMAFLNKDQLKFHSYQDTKLLMEAIEKRYGGNKESKKSTSSTNEADTTASGVSTAHTQSTTINSTSVDNLSDAEMDLHCEMDMLTIRAKRFMKRTDMNLGIENQLYCKVKVIRCDNGTEFKNSVMNQFCEDKGIKKEFSVAKTPQQNRVTERRNRTLIEATRTMDNLGKFERKADEGYFVEYSVVSKAIGVFNKRTRIVEEILNIIFQANAPNVKGNRPDWLFDIDSLTISMNYVPVITGKQTNGIAGSKENLVAGTKDSAVDARKKAPEEDEIPRSEFESLLKQEMQTKNINSTNSFNTVSSPVNIVGSSFVNATSQTPINAARPSTSTNAFEEHSFERFSPFKNAFSLPHIPIVTPIDDTGIFGNAYNDEVLEEEVDMNNVDSSYTILEATKFLKDHPQEQVIGSLETPVQTRKMSKTHEEFGLLSSVHKLRRTNHKDFQNCLFACFLTQMEPKKPVQDLQDPNWVEAMQDELLQFKLNKKDERGIVIKNKARLVAQGHTQEEGIDYDEVFAPVARIKAIRLFLAYASFKDFVVYQMDVKSAFLYKIIKDEVYVCQTPGFKDPNIPDKVYKVEKALYGLHQAPRAWYETLSTYLLDNGIYRGQIDKTLFIKRHKDDILLVQVYVDDIIFGSTKKELSTEFEKLMHDKFQMSSMGKLYFFLGLHVKQKSDGIFISQDKYVAEVLKKFDFVNVKTASQAKLGLWYPKDSPFDLEAYSDSDYVGAILDRKSATGGCQFLGKRQVLWIQNQMLDYGFNLMNTKIYIDNESTICIVKNPVFYSKTKHIEIRHHFIKDSYEKKLIQVIKIHTDKNVADLLTKAFDVSRVKSPMEKDSLGAQDDASKQGRMIEEIDQNAEIALDAKTQGSTNDDEMFGVDDFGGEKVVMETTIGVKDSDAPTIDVTEDEITMALALAALKSIKPKVVVQEQEMSTTILADATIVTTAIPTPRAKGIVFHKQKQLQIPTVSSSKDKGKDKMIEPEVPIKKKDLMRIDEDCNLSAAPTKQQ
nr:putative ribonuclease H-like domain-containing protein [Tanacetum cinerariifolium]